MVTTNDSIPQNFYVYTDDIYGEWSEPILVEQDGIDPSLFLEDGKTYFISNGSDEKGVGCIQMSEIDIETGKMLTPSKVLWHGTGGRYLESPHLYRFGEYYYLVEAEGGTEYGHMANYARSKAIWGPYESYSNNPVLTNRNLGGYQLQAAGHGDIVEDANGNWWFMHLAFRQIHKWHTFHHLGREACLVPLYWQEDGWFTMGTDGTCQLEFELPDNVVFKEQELSYEKTFENLDTKLDWCFLRIPENKNYRFSDNALELCGTKITLDETASPTFAAIRQTEFDITLCCDVECGQQECGISFYMDELHHYEIGARPDGTGRTTVFVRQTIGCVSQESKQVICDAEKVSFEVIAEAEQYHFYLVNGIEKIHLSDAYTRYLSTEVASGFTGVMIGFYAVNPAESKEWSRFTALSVVHKQ